MTFKNGFRVWDDEYDREHFTPEEIMESNMRVAVVGELIKAREEHRITQKQFEELSMEIESALDTSQAVTRNVNFYSSEWQQPDIPCDNREFLMPKAAEYANLQE